MTQQFRKPNLFVIGAMKSGTTSLHQYLDTHPQIAMSEQKEPAYFAEEFTLRRGENWYLRLFPQDTQYSYRGESSTQYTRLPLYKGVPERLHRFNPDARLIYVMRNPFERLVSHYWHDVRVRSILTQAGEPRSLLKAVRRDQDGYLATSDYAMQLEPYIRLFGTDALYTLTFEALIADPQRELDKIYHWLGLPSHSLGKELTLTHNQKPIDTTSAAGAGILYRIRFSETWHRLAPYVPDALKRYAKSLAYRPVDEQQTHNERARLKVEVGALQRRQIERLSELLKRDFPEWRDAQR